VRKYEDALVKALNTASLEVLVWACKQVGGQLIPTCRQWTTMFQVLIVAWNGIPGQAG
jgi:hypothetical protein